MKTRKLNAKTIAFIGMLGALAAVLMFVNVPIPFVPPFYRLDVSELPALFAGFFLGPVAGIIVTAIKIVIYTLVAGTSTGYVGEAMNFAGAAVFVVVAVLIYRAHRTKKGAIAALTVSSVVCSIVWIFYNAYIAFPLYTKVMGIPMEALVQMGTAVNPLIKSELTFMLFGVFPFNLIKHGVTSVITFLVYKKASNVLRGILGIED